MTEYAYDAMNRYAYAANNPVNFDDPSGMFFEQIGDFFGAIAQGATWLAGKVVEGAGYVAGSVVGVFNKSAGNYIKSSSRALGNQIADAGKAARATLRSSGAAKDKAISTFASNISKGKSVGYSASKARSSYNAYIQQKKAEEKQRKTSVVRNAFPGYGVAYQGDKVGIVYNGRFVEITSPEQAQAIKACMNQLEKEQKEQELEKARTEVATNKVITVSQNLTNSTEQTTNSDIVGAFDSLYDYFTENGQADDADNVLLHKSYYLDGEYTDDWNVYNSRREQQRYKGSYPNGHMVVDVYEEPSTGQNILKNGISSVAGALTGFGWLSDLASIGKMLNLPAYYEYNPGEILQSGDIEVYYSNNPNGGYGNYYYYRGDELLYIANDGKSLDTKGENFDVYTQNNSRDYQDALEDGVSLVIDEVLKGLF